MKTKSVLSSRLNSFGTNPPGGSGGVRPSAGRLTRFGPKAPRCSQTLLEPGPPLKQKVTGRFLASGFSVSV